MITYQGIPDCKDQSVGSDDAADVEGAMVTSSKKCGLCGVEGTAVLDLCRECAKAACGECMVDEKCVSCRSSKPEEEPANEPSAPKKDENSDEDAVISDI